MPPLTPSSTRSPENNAATPRVTPRRSRRTRSQKSDSLAQMFGIISASSQSSSGRSKNKRKNVMEEEGEPKASPKLENEDTRPQNQRDSSSNSSDSEEEPSKGDVDDDESDSSDPKEEEKSQDDESQSSSEEDVALGQLTPKSKSTRKSKPKRMKLSTWKNRPVKAKGGKKKKESDEEYTDEGEDSSSENDDKEFQFDSEHEDNSSDDDIPQRRGRKMKSQGRQRRTLQRTKKMRKQVKFKQDSSSASSSEESESVARTPAKGRQGSRTLQRTRNKSAQEIKSESSKNDNDSSSDESSVAPTLRSRNPRSASKRIVNDSDDEDSDDSSTMELQKVVARKNNVQKRKRESSDEGDDAHKEVNKKQRRQSPRGSLSKRKPTVDTEDSSSSNGSESEDDGNGDNRKKAATPKGRRKKKPSSDDEFTPGSGSESSSEEEEAYEEEEEEEEEELQEDESLVGDAELSDDDDDIPLPLAKSKATNIDQEKIGSADMSSSSSEDELEVSAPAAKGKQSTLSKRGRRDEILPSQTTLYSTDDESDNEQSPQKSNNQSRLERLPPCTSTEDAITFAPLPKKHICFVSPDGSSRQCFALETLRQAALKCARTTTRVDNAGEQHMNFLQPPHFRAPMSDDLIDQIASRFGRDATDPQSAYFNRKHIADYFDRNDDGEDDSNHDPDFDYDAPSFMEHVNSYIQKQMGSQDIYVCPLCYSEIHHRVNRIDRGVGSDDERDYFEFVDRHDPMTVLGWEDNDKFEMASLFCFKKVAQLKEHLREVHQIDTKQVVGNDLYKRYKVRDSDALLQRWVKTTWKPKSGGVMQHYWYAGYNQSFVFLLNQIKLADSYRDTLANAAASDENSSSTKEEEADEYLSRIHDFVDKFQDRAKKLWTYISAPFGKQQDDIKNWIDDGEVEEEDVEFSHAAAMRDMDTNNESDQNDFTHKLERKYSESNKKRTGSSDDDKSSSSSSLEIIDAPQNGNGREESSDAEEEEEEDKSHYYSEVEEENDAWVVQRKQRPTRALKESRRKANDSDEEDEGEGAKTTGVGERPSTPSPQNPAETSDQEKVAVRTTSSKKRRRIAIQDSSDEDS